MKSNIVLDLGIGKVPTICRLRANEEFKKIGKDLLPIISDPHLQYIGFDRESSGFDECHQHMKNYAPHVSFTTQCGDAVSLPFPDNYFSLVILSDVLSIPDHDWCMCDYECMCRCKSCECRQETISFLPRYANRRCCGGAYHGLPEVQKNAILMEVFRVLHKEGSLLVAVSQTPEYTHDSMQFLETSYRLTKKHLETWNFDMDKHRFIFSYSKI